MRLARRSLPHPLLVLVPVVVLLTLWTWRRTADPLVDFGQQLYMPWRLVEGDVLYRDLSYPYGPLAVHVNALAFSVFGVSLTTVSLLNVAIFLGIVAAAERVFRRCCDRMTSLAAGLTLACVFGFGQYVTISNYNFVTPYSHELTHAIALGAAGLWLLGVRLGSGRRIATVGAGLAVGLAWLAKPEAFVAAAAGVGVGWLALLRLEGLRLRPALAELALLGGSALVPPLVAFGWFLAAMPPADAIRAAGGAWEPVLGRSLTRFEFYRVSMGFDEPALRALAMLRQAGIVLAVCALGLLAEFLARRAELASRAGIAICVFVVAVLVAEVEPGAWLAVGGGLPVLTLLALGGFAWLVLHRRERWPLVLLAWSVWALALLAKMPLNARIYSYGFALAMPAGVLLVAVLLGVVPRLAPRAWGGLPVYRGAIAGVVIAACIGFLRVTDLHNRHKTFAFGRGADTILTYGPGPPTNLPYGVGLQRALELVEALPEGSTVAAVPMGAMLNYQARRPSSSSFGQFTPFSQHVSGTDAVERSLLESPPDYVVLVHAHLPGFGMGFFGRDPRNAGRVWQWLQTDYVLREQIFDPPFREVGKFGIQLLERRKDGS